jgi:DNA polymerase III delta subunit
MKLIDFKKLITENKINITYSYGYPCFIFVCEDNYFVGEQYVKYLANIKDKDILYTSIDAFDTIISSSATTKENNYLYVIKTSKLLLDDDSIDKLKRLGEVVILCNEIDKNTKDELEKLHYDSLIYIPKLKDWHIKEYVANFCPGLKPEQIDWICNINQNNIYSISNQISAIEIFDKEIQDIILDELIEANNYFVVDNLITYKICNSIMKKDIASLLQCLEYSMKLAIDPFMFIGAMKKTIQNIINIQMNPKATADSLGMSYGQFRAIQYSCNKYSNIQLVNLLKFITSLDYRIKSGNLPLEDNELTDYVILTCSSYMV